MTSVRLPKIYDDVQIMALPDPEWQVQGLFEYKTLVVLYGPTGHGKTFVTLDIAFSVGTGTPFLGRAVRQGRVAYIYAEGTAGAKKRTRGWKQEHGFSEHTACNVYFIPEPVSITQPGPYGVGALIQVIRETCEHVDLVVIDTLARCFGGKNEDSTQDMSLFTYHCDQIRNELDATVLIVHHTGRDLSRERGNMALKSNSDAQIRCVQKGDSNRLEITCEKLKDDEAFSRLVVLRTRVELRDGSTTCVIRHEKALSGAEPVELTPNGFRALKTLGQAEMTFSEWHEASRLGDSSFKRARTELVKHRLVGTPPNGRSTKGFKYEVTRLGKQALGVQDDGGPNTDRKPTEEGEVHPKVQPKTLTLQAESNGSTKGPGGVQDPWAWMGPYGGAYRAPHGPEPESGTKESD